MTIQATDKHRERARRMFGCMFDADDLAQILATHEAEVSTLQAFRSCLEEVNAAYRLGGQPGGKYLDQLAALRAAEAGEEPA